VKPKVLLYAFSLCFQVLHHDVADGVNVILVSVASARDTSAKATEGYVMTSMLVPTTAQHILHPGCVGYKATRF
jgi:hypothetical protein